MNLPLGTPAMRKVLDRIAEASTREAQQEQLDADVKAMRERNEQLVTEYIRNFWLREKR